MASRDGKNDGERKTGWGALSSVVGAPVSGTVPARSVYVPERNPTPRSTEPGTPAWRASSGSAGRPGLVTTPDGPTRYVKTPPGAAGRVLPGRGREDAALAGDQVEALQAEHLARPEADGGRAESGLVDLDRPSRREVSASIGRP